MIVNFGKYYGKDISILKQDKNYCKWLIETANKDSSSKLANFVKKYLVSQEIVKQLPRKICIQGGVNKITGCYLFPNFANRDDEYNCPDCGKDLVLCKGEIRIPYFRHKIHTINPCTYYDKPSESQIHKDAKLIIKKLIEEKVELTFERDCERCNKIKVCKVIKYNENMIVKLEDPFIFSENRKIADLALYNKVICPLMAMR